MRHYFSVMVPYYIPVAWVAAVLGLIASRGHLGSTALLAFVSLAALVGGFNTLNGMADVRIDRINKPGRPIPAGTLSSRAAAIWATILYAVAFASGAMVSKPFIIIVAAAAVLTAAYSVPPIRLRRHFIGANSTGTLFYGVLCPLAGWAINPANPVPLAVLPFTALLTFGLSITKDLEDIVGDSAYGIATVPVVLGVRGSALLTAAGVAAAFGYMAAVVFAGLFGPRFLLLLLVLPVMLLLIKEVYARGSDHHIHRGVAKRIFLALVGLGIATELAFIVIATL